MPSNKDTLSMCSISRYRLLLHQEKQEKRGEGEGGGGEGGGEGDGEGDVDVQKMEEGFRLAIEGGALNVNMLCLYGQFLEKKKDYMGAEGVFFVYFGLNLLIPSSFSLPFQTPPSLKIIF